MTSKAETVDDYLRDLPEDRQEAMSKLREVVIKNLPSGFQEVMSYGMPSYAVPRSIYPDGYHCKPSEPLPFLSIASQKNFVAVYHMGIYAMPKLYDWFVNEYPKHVKTKLDMGKSCVRLKKVDQIPFDLIAELCTKVSVDEWIEVYERELKK